MVCIHNAKVVLETGILFDGVVLLDGDRIAAVGERRTTEIPSDCEMIDAKGAYVGPGFVDIHVHGGNGHMFDAEPLQAAEHFGYPLLQPFQGRLFGLHQESAGSYGSRRRR